MKRLFALILALFCIAGEKCTGTDLRLLANVAIAGGFGGFAQEVGKNLSKKDDLIPQAAKWGAIAYFGPVVCAFHVINDGGWTLSGKFAQKLKVDDKRVVVQGLYCAWVFVAWYLLMKADRKFGIPATWKELYHRLT